MMQAEETQKQRPKKSSRTAHKETVGSLKKEASPAEHQARTWRVGVPLYVYWGIAVAVLVILLVAAIVFMSPGMPQVSGLLAADAGAGWEQSAFDGNRAYQYLVSLCRIGPRPSGSEGMQRQQLLLEKHFNRLGAQVLRQEFWGRHPRTGQPVKLVNLIVRWFPDRQDRILLCAHYDTRPYPSLDPHNPRGVFVGANDGASGVAVLMELGHHVPALRTPYGVDFVLFDAEEFVFSERDPYFVGSKHFAQAYASGKLPYRCRYRWGVLLDMVGDADLQIFQERNSMWWADTRPLVQEIWAVARQLGVREFIPRKKYEVYDDHLMLHNIGRIPTCVIIDFDYPAWHTQQDLPDRCSPESLKKVGAVILAWLEMKR